MQQYIANYPLIMVNHTKHMSNIEISPKYLILGMQMAKKKNFQEPILKRCLSTVKDSYLLSFSTINNFPRKGIKTCKSYYHNYQSGFHRVK